MTGDLFPIEKPRRSRRTSVPLADRMRPQRLDDVVGQDHLLAPGRPFRQAVEKGQLSSLLLWGPPGSGKTTIARLVAVATGHRFVAYSAVTSGVAEIRKVVAAARVEIEHSGRPTVLFVDEIHRFNKAQQDAFLPHVESGLLVLVGATTENPSFEVNSALLSRVQVHVLQPLAAGHLIAVIERALADSERGLGATGVELEEGAREALVALSGGDARVVLNLLENAAAVAGKGGRIGSRLVEEVAGRPAIRHDRAGDLHYDLISALIKSVRGSDPDAALYWLARMLEGGEDPLFIARRLVILASEDIGNAEPQALPLAMAAHQAAHSIGLPEAGLVLSQVTTYLAVAPKSNSALVALTRARKEARRTGGEPVPLHLRNAPTPLMAELGHGKGYRYPHTEEDDQQEYLPERLRDRRFYEPGDNGFERDMARRVQERRRDRDRKRPSG